MLQDGHVSDKNYQHAKKVCTEFDIKRMWYYYDLFLKTDVIKQMFVVSRCIWTS